MFPDHSLLVPPHLQELYDMYIRELDERKLDRAVALDKATTKHTIRVKNINLELLYVQRASRSASSSALVFRRALCRRSRFLVTTCRMWTPTRRVYATCALRASEVRPRSADTRCHPSSPNRSCKRTLSVDDD